MESNEINVLGFSQGTLIGRYIVVECLEESDPVVRNIISVGGPNMGE